jgi:hypothetical protein
MVTEIAVISSKNYLCNSIRHSIAKNDAMIPVLTN